MSYGLTEYSMLDGNINVALEQRWSARVEASWSSGYVLIFLGG